MILFTIAVKCGRNMSPEGCGEKSGRILESVRLTAGICSRSALAGDVVSRIQRTDDPRLSSGGRSCPVRVRRLLSWQLGLGAGHGRRPDVRGDSFDARITPAPVKGDEPPGIPRSDWRGRLRPMNCILNAVSPPELQSNAMNTAPAVSIAAR